MPTPYRNTRNNTRSQTTNGHYPYFVFVMSNYPNLIQRTQAFQRPNQNWQRQYQGGMLIPGVRVHVGAVRTDADEQLLYNTLRYQLEQIIRAYLYQTYPCFPIYLVFDLSNMDDQFL